MGKEELYKRQNTLCAFPFTGFVIGPKGDITLCCETSNQSIGNIKNINDLKEFYNSEKMEYYRRTMEDGKIENLNRCNNCYKHFKTLKISHYFAGNTFDHDWNLRKQNLNRPIRYLEFTCSNTCNQTCSTCNGFFSSKWVEIEKNFTVKDQSYFSRISNPSINRLNDNDVNKIINIIPDLNTLMAKGGEPFADKNNIKILEAAAKSESIENIIIISNMQAISKRTIKVLNDISKAGINLSLCASIDGVGRVYDWIRGGSFNTTVSNIKRIFEFTGFKVDIIPFMSLHNIFDIINIIDYFEDKEYVYNISLNNVSEWPNYIQFQTLPDDILENQLKLIIDRCKSSDIISYDYVLTFEKKKSNPTTLKHCFDWIDKMNEIRGFNLEDYVPQLQRIKAMQ